MSEITSSPPAAAQRRRRGPRPATPERLENAALHYLQRYASSAENLRRVLMRRVLRSARVHGTDPGEGAAAIEALLRRLQRNGLLDDRLYAEGKARSLHRRGASQRLIRARLGEKGVEADVVEAAVAGLDDLAAHPDLAAGIALARRRGLGPFRPAAERRDRRARDLAALGRAGFPYEIARTVIDAEGPEALEALAAGES